jgi:hypothetical protein
MHMFLDLSKVLLLNVHIISFNRRWSMMIDSLDNSLSSNYNNFWYLFVIINSELSNQINDFDIINDE